MSIERDDRTETEYELNGGKVIPRTRLTGIVRARFDPGGMSISALARLVLSAVTKNPTIVCTSWRKRLVGKLPLTVRNLGVNPIRSRLEIMNRVEVISSSPVMFALSSVQITFIALTFWATKQNTAAINSLLNIKSSWMLNNTI